MRAFRKDRLGKGQPKAFLLGIPTRPNTRVGVDDHKVVTQASGIEHTRPDQGPLDAATTEPGHGAVNVHVCHTSVLSLHEGQRTTASDLAVDFSQVKDCVCSNGSHLGQALQDG